MAQTNFLEPNKFFTVPEMKARLVLTSFANCSKGIRPTFLSLKSPNDAPDNKCFEMRSVRPNRFHAKFPFRFFQNSDANETVK